jgi:MFS family permease
MPIYANEILKVGPSGLGILRAAPAVGAGFTALGLAYLPPLRRAGTTMFLCVALFGIFTILFGISTNFIFSLFCLFILGAADMVSVVIRGVLVQIKTPPVMRGKVSAVNLVFIGASNEIGEFESGLTAAWFGVVPAVVIGGIGTLIVVGLWAWRFPELRQYKRLEDSS